MSNSDSLRILTSSCVFYDAPLRSLFSLASGLLFFLSQAACSRERYELTIIHTNDFHAQIDPYNKNYSKCSQADLAGNECYGGVSRQKTAIDGIRKEADNTLLLDAGDHISGSVFFDIFKGKASQELMNSLGYDAMTVGNHELDGGELTLAEFLKGINFPALSLNIHPQGDSPLVGLIRPYIILTIGGMEVAILGYIGPDASQRVSEENKIKFSPVEDELQRVLEEIRLRRVNIVIALSHSGLEKDVEIAEKFSGIDVIVGGHCHTLLSNSSLDAKDKYPIVRRSPKGDKVIIVSVGVYGKYLGRLDLTFDKYGRVFNYSGDALLLDAQIPEEPEIKNQVDKYQGQLTF